MPLHADASLGRILHVSRGGFISSGRGAFHLPCPCFPTISQVCIRRARGEGGGRVALAVVFTGVVPFSAPLVLAGLGLDESAIAPVIALAVYLAWRLRVRLPNQGGCHGLVRRTSTGGEPMLAVGGSPWSPVLSFRALHCRVPQSRPRAMSSNALRVLPDVPGRDIQVLLPAFAPACGTGHEAVKPPFRCRSSWPLACASWITVSK
jgi:hypothetical protein